MSRKTKAEAKQTQHALLNAAIKLFVRQGVARTTLNDIAHEARVTRGAAYWHFDNKDAVILALWERNASAAYSYFIEEIGSLCKSANAGESVRETLKASIRDLMANTTLGQVMHIVFHHVEFTDEQTPLQVFLYRQESQLFDVMELLFETLAEHDGLKAKPPPALLSRSFLAYMRGLLEMQLTSIDRGVDLVRDGDVYVDLFFDAILAD